VPVASIDLDLTGRSHGHTFGVELPQETVQKTRSRGTFGPSVLSRNVREPVRRGR
jgi:hypothetical protein